MLDARSLRWDILELGVTASESAALEFLVRHVGQQSGTKLVNQSITYSDREGNLVSFPKPAVTVECEIVVHPEPCPQPVELTVEGCRDSVLVALAAILTEVDQNGMEHQKGMKAMTIPAHDSPTIPPRAGMYWSSA